MDWLWKFESLVGLIDHENPLVRGWAMERLTVLYPERVGPVAVRFVDDPVEAVQKAALLHLGEVASRDSADKLLAIYAARSDDVANMAAAALARLGDLRLIDAFQRKFTSLTDDRLHGFAVSVFHIAALDTPAASEVAVAALRQIAAMDLPINKAGEAMQLVFAANLRAGCSADSLLDFCFARTNCRPWLPACLSALGDECGAWFTENDLLEDPPRQKVPEFTWNTLAALADAGFKGEARRLEKLVKKRRHEEILSILFALRLKLREDAKRRIGIDGLTRWERGRGMPRTQMAAIDALGRHAKGKDAAAVELMARAGLWIFEPLIELRPLIGLDIEGLDAEGLLKVFLQERIDVEEDRRIAERLTEAVDQEKIGEAILRCIESNPNTRAEVRLLEYLGKGLNTRAAARLLALHDAGFMLADNLPMVLPRLGAPLLDLLPPLITEKKPVAISLCLELIDRLPMEGAVQLVLKHWELFWEWDKSGLLEVIQDIGDSRFIAPLREELKVIEVLEGRTYQLLCLLHGKKDPLIETIEAEVQRVDRRRRKRLEAFESGGMRSMAEQPLDLELKCRRCRKTYGYEVFDVTLLKGAEGEYLIADQIRCKNCGAVNNYEKTAEANTTVMVRTLALAALGNEASDLKQEGPLHFAESKLIGRKARSISEALQYYEELLKKHPDRVAHLIGYANTLSNAKRADDAVAAYRKAIEHDPLAVEALLSLGQYEAAYENKESAYAYLERAVAALDSGNYYHVGQDLEEFKAGVRDIFEAAAQELGKEPQWPLRQAMPARRAVKIGRNDPCPCGSGRKYKKCCLQL